MLFRSILSPSSSFTTATSCAGTTTFDRTCLWQQSPHPLRIPPYYRRITLTHARQPEHNSKVVYTLANQEHGHKLKLAWNPEPPARSGKRSIPPHPTLRHRTHCEITPERRWTALFPARLARLPRGRRAGRTYTRASSSSSQWTTSLDVPQAPAASSADEVHLPLPHHDTPA